ncbi:MAG: CbtB-domain containing protein [Nocardioides sp.]
MNQINPAPARAPRITTALPRALASTLSGSMGVLWLAAALLLGVTSIFFLGIDQGSISVTGGTLLHELFHDARHSLGFPCH